MRANLLNVNDEQPGKFNRTLSLARGKRGLFNRKDGDLAAQVSVGIYYRDGVEVAQNNAEAVKWFQKAADKGYADAQYNLGWMYENDLGVVRDLKKASELYEKAAKQDHVFAQYRLGIFHSRGVVTDYQQACAWLVQASQQGCLDALKAIESLAKQGNVIAQYNLGVVYQHGYGVPPDDACALQWYLKAAAQGHLQAQGEVEKLQTKLQKSFFVDDSLKALSVMKSDVEKVVAVPIEKLDLEAYSMLKTEIILEYSVEHCQLIIEKTLDVLKLKMEFLARESYAFNPPTDIIANHTRAFLEKILAQSSDEKTFTMSKIEQFLEMLSTCPLVGKSFEECLNAFLGKILQIKVTLMGCRRVLVLGEKLERPKSVEPCTIILQKKDGLVAAFWHQNDAVIEKNLDKHSIDACLSGTGFGFSKDSEMFEITWEMNRDFIDKVALLCDYLFAVQANKSLAWVDSVDEDDAGRELSLLRENIEKAKENARAAEQLDLVFFIGNTGCGKSTIINYIHGCQFEFSDPARARDTNAEESAQESISEPEEGDERLVVSEASEIKEITTIGYTDQSQTSEPVVFRDESVGLAYCDCPGFSDNRGSIVNITNAVSIRHTISTAKSIKIVVLIDCHTFKAVRGQLLHELKKTLSELFGDLENIKKNNVSILVMITKLQGLSHPVREFNRIKKKLCSDIEETIIPWRKENIFFYAPLHEQQFDSNQGFLSREKLIQQIGSLPSVQDHHAIFKTVLTELDYLYVIKKARIIVNKIRKSLESDAFSKAAEYLYFLANIQIVERSDVDELYQDGVKQIQSYIKNLILLIQQQSSSNEFEEAEKNLMRFMQIELAFATFLAEFEIKAGEAKTFLREKRLGFIMNRVDNAANTLTAFLDNDPSLLGGSANNLYIILKKNQLNAETVYSVLRQLLKLPHANRMLVNVLALNVNLVTLGCMTQYDLHSPNYAKGLETALNAIHLVKSRVQKIVVSENKKQLVGMRSLVIASITNIPDHETVILPCLMEWKRKATGLDQLFVSLLAVPSLQGKVKAIATTLQESKKIAEFLEDESVCLDYADLYKQVEFHLNGLFDRLARYRMQEIRVKLTDTLDLFKQVTWKSDGPMILVCLENYRSGLPKPNVLKFLDELSAIRSIRVYVSLMKSMVIEAGIIAEFSESSAYHELIQRISSTFSDLEKQLLRQRMEENKGRLVEIRDLIIANLDSISDREVTALPWLIEWHGNLVDVERLCRNLSTIPTIQDKIRVILNGIAESKKITETNKDDSVRTEYGVLHAKINEHLKSFLKRVAHHRMLEIQIKVSGILAYFKKITWNDCGKALLDCLKKHELNLLQWLNELSVVGGSIRQNIHILKDLIIEARAIGKVHDESVVYQLERQIFDVFFTLEQQFLLEEKNEKVVFLLKTAKDKIKKNVFMAAQKDIQAIEQLDAAQLKQLPLEECRDRLTLLVETSFNASNYEVAAINLKNLMQLNEALKEFFEKLKIELNVQKIKTDLLVRIDKLCKDAKEEMENGFNDKILKCDIKAQRGFPFEKVEAFANVSKHFGALLEIAQINEIQGLCLGKIRAITVDRTKSRLPDEVATVLVQVHGLVYSMNDPKLIPALEDVVLRTLDQYPEEYIIRIGDSLVALQEQKIGKMSKSATELIEKNPCSDTINTILFNKKASKPKAEVFHELKIDDQSPVYHSYLNYERRYQLIITQIIQASLPASSISVLDQCKRLKSEAVSHTQKIVAAIHKKDTPAQYPAETGEIIANIFGAWTCLNAEKGGFGSKETRLMQPHAAQVVSVLLLLGMQNHAPMKHHLLEVKTGEGKSVTTAASAIVLALLGYRVDVACYNPYLAERDKRKFEELFSLFRVGTKIRYRSFDVLINSAVRTVGDTRQLATQLLQGKVVGGTRAANQEDTVLLIDEVDVFFGENFLGNTCRTCVIIKDESFQKLLHEIWKDRKELLKDKPLAKKKIHGQPLMKEFLKNYPNVTQMLGWVLDDVLDGLSAVHDGRHKYDNVNAQFGIGYKDTVQAQIVYNVYHSYRTAFAYIKEMELNNLSETMVKQHIGLQVSTGSLSYAELPKNYDLILGVTGTLFSLSYFEQEIIQGYLIDQKTLIPSIFQKKQCVQDEIVVCDGHMDAEDDLSYFNVIKKNIEEVLRADRAVLVVFQAEERLFEFKKFIELHPYQLQGVRTNCLTLHTPPRERDFFIQMAADRGQITLLTASFGRGSDFVCRDSAVRKNKGVHVIQTFFSEYESEEVQIRGRTCRQDDPGSYSMILFLEDLRKFGIKQQSEVDDFSQLLGSKAGKQSDSIRSNRWYEYLKSKRTAYLADKGKQLFESVTRALENHERTIEFINILEAYGNLGSLDQMVRQQYEAKAINLLLHFNGQAPKEKMSASVRRTVTLKEKDQELLIQYQDLKIGEKLGEGGFGVVYKGTWRVTDVAIKELLPNLTEEAIEEFEAEAQTMKRLRSPNIVQFFGYCVSPKYCIVMEYMPQGSLFKLLHSPNEMTWEIRMRIAMDMARGLVYLHEENILHRDIKSLNVLLKDNAAKLADFGLAKVKQDIQSTSTRSSVGTIPWMAPELFFSDIGCTKASDVYSLGITFWELASRRIPFQKVTNPVMIPIQVASGYRDEIPDCPPKFASVIQACWEGTPDNRPNAVEVAEFLISQESRMETFLPGFRAKNKSKGSILNKLHSRSGTQGLFV